jgi:hypothetical protein
VRDEIRAGMMTRMLDIINRQYQGATLTTHENNLYLWFKNQVRLERKTPVPGRSE